MDCSNDHGNGQYGHSAYDHVDASFGFEGIQSSIYFPELNDGDNSFEGIGMQDIDFEIGPSEPQHQPGQTFSIPVGNHGNPTDTDPNERYVSGSYPPGSLPPGSYRSNSDPTAIHPVGFQNSTMSWFSTPSQVNSAISSNKPSEDRDTRRDETSSRSDSPKFGYPKKRSRSYSNISRDDEASAKGQARHRTVVEMIELNPQDDLRIAQWLEQFKSKRDLPSIDDMEELAKRVDLSFHRLLLLCGALLKFAPSDVHSKPEVEGWIQQYIKKHWNQECSRGTSSGKKYPCTRYECDYSTDSRDAWEQHEETRQPQEFWVCKACMDDVKIDMPHINHRGDKFLMHAVKQHGDKHEKDKGKKLEAAKEVRRKSKVVYDAPFEAQCTINLHNGQQCDHVATSWKNRCEHFFSHFDPKQRRERVQKRPRTDVSRDADTADN